MPSGETKKYSDERLKEYGEKLIAWARAPDNYFISGFEDENDLYEGWCLDMSKNRKDVFFRPFKRAKEILGRKLFKLTIDKHGPTPWVQQVVIPMYIKDVDDHIDSKIKRKIELEAESKAREGDKQNAKCDELIEKIEGFIEAEDGKASK